MNRRDGMRLKRILEAISDRDPVDWDAEGHGHPPRTLDAVRLLDGVMKAHRRRDRDTGDGSAPPWSPGGGRGSWSNASAAADRGEPRRRARTTRRWGQLQLLEKIGEGSFGEVFRAYDPGLEIEVALKLRHRASRDASREEQILDEARRLARVRHPNVLVVHGVAKRGGRVGMWTELLSGQTLEELLAVGGPVGAGEAARIGIQVCRALGALHGASLIHRDVKAANVMRELGGRIVLMDFGAVRESDVQGNVDPREAGIGTPLAMAPEVLRGQPASVASDIYGLGVLLYRLVSGSYPIGARSLDELLAGHSAAERGRVLDWRPGHDPALARAIERALAPEPDDRYTSVAAFERRLTGCIRASVHGRRPRSAAEHAGTPEAGPTTLPYPGTSFVGRHRELRECGELLLRGRLLTLTGFGGCGKTRLAIGVAEDLRSKFPDGVWFVDLATVSNPSHVPQAIASALSIRQQAGATLGQCLEDELRTMTALIVLDNCEHLIQACSGLVRSIMTHCRRTSFCVTSREPLGIEAEQIYVVPALLLPPEHDREGAARIGAAESVRLFVDRARLVQRDFALTDRNAPTVAAICRRLDGIPLAIELAAAKTRLLLPEEILAKLARRTGLLTRDTGGGVPRHQTLRATFQWSFDLLSDEERSLMTSLTAFVGTWRLEDAVAMHGGEELNVLRTLTRLVSKSLVCVDHRQRFATSYRLLEPVRDFIEESNDDRLVKALRRRHARHYVTLASLIEAGLAGPDQSRWLDFIQCEHANLLAAMEWMLARVGEARRASRRDADSVLGLVAAMWRYWCLRGHFAVGRAVLTRAIEVVGRQAGPRARAAAIWASGFLATFQGDSEAARPLFERSLDLFRGVHDERGVARAHGGLGIVATDRGDYVAARPHYERSLAILRAAGREGEVATALNNLGAVTWRLGDYDAAAALHVEGLEHARRAGHRESLILNLINLSWIAVRQARPEQATRWLSEALPCIVELGARQRAAEAFEITAEVLASRNEWAKAVRLASRAEALREEIEAPPEDLWRKAQERLRTRARDLLTPDRYGMSWRSGRELEFEQAAATAALWLSRPPEPPAR